MLLILSPFLSPSIFIMHSVKPVPVVPPPRLNCVAPQLVMQHPEDKWEIIQVTRDSAVMDVPRPFGHCLVPYRKGI
jgi:hypothetical protein